MEENKKLTIKSWAEEDRPREKLVLKGKHSLSNAELLAILIGSGSRNESAVELCKRIMSEAAQDDLIDLGKLSVKDLQKFKGIGEAKAITIVAALELGRRREGAEIREKTLIAGSGEVVKIFHPLLVDLPHEEFWMLLMNRANKIISKEKISTGGVSGTVVDPKIIFRRALEMSASGIILCHNHPSGNPKPSQADIDLTKKLKRGGDELEISVLDHIIIAENKFFSFADEGMM